MAESRRNYRSVVEYRRRENRADAWLGTLLRRTARIWNWIADRSRFARRSGRDAGEACWMEGNRSRQSWIRTGRGSDADAACGRICGDCKRWQYRASIRRKGRLRYRGPRVADAYAAGD